MIREALQRLKHSRIDHRFFCPESFHEDMKTIHTFERFVTDHPDAFHRFDLPGHFTASAAIVDNGFMNICLVFHQKLRKWLQPGGHADGDRDLKAVALREVREETGLQKISVSSVNFSDIFDLDRHSIPATTTERAHDHYDVRFLVIARRSESLKISDESADLAWHPISTAHLLNPECSMQRMFKKIEALRTATGRLGTLLLTVLLLSCQGSKPRGLDTTFGTGGKTTTAIGLADDDAFAAFLQSDGKIVVAGRTFSSGQSDFALARYDTKGILDASFGTNGKVTTDFSGANDVAYATLVLPDGSILAGGTAGGGAASLMAFAKYTSAGILDPSFDNDGKLSVPIGESQDEVRAMAIQSDGSIVAAGFSKSPLNFDIAVVRFTRALSLDTSFDNDGKKTLAPGSGDDKAFSIALQSDGKIVVSGSSVSNSITQFVVARLNASGEPDTSFGQGSGYQTVSSSFSPLTQETATGVSVLADGSLVLSGTSDDGKSQQILAVRVGPSGVLFSDFDNDGKRLTRYSSDSSSISSRVSAQMIQPDGDIVVVGTHAASSGKDFGIFRFTNSGNSDAAFGTDGSQTLDFGSQDEATALALGGSSAIYVVGRAYNGSNYDFAVAKYHQ